jgi:hypothetical protein
MFKPSRSPARKRHQVCFFFSSVIDPEDGSIMLPETSVNFHQKAELFKSTTVSSNPVYRMFQKELYNFESLYKIIQRTSTVF